MTWTQVVGGFDQKIRDETRAGILVGYRLPDGITSAVALEAQAWARSKPGVDLWIVDDLKGLSDSQPIFVGIVLHQAFGIDGDHRIGLTPGEYEKRVAEATRRMKELRPEAEVHPYFVWSGPLCGGFLVKGVFKDEYNDKDVWFESEAELKIYPSCEGAHQGHAPGGVYGVELFMASYDTSDIPPILTPEFLSAGDRKLADGGLLKESRIFVLSHYD